MAKCYATLNQLKDPGYLNIPNTDYDATLLRILENVSEDIDYLCYRHFDCFEGTQYFDGSGRTLIPADDILSISSLSLDMDGDGTYETTVSSTDYAMYPLNGYSIWPKLYLKLNYRSTCGGFASGIPAGVKITGVFGHGDGNSATPYSSLGITGTVATTSGTTLTVSAEGVLQPGHTIRIDSEQLYVTAVTTDGSKTATVVRAVNGTIGAAHSTATIYLYRYPGPVVESCLLWATNVWKQRENPTIFKSGNSVTGEYQLSGDIEQIMRKRLGHHIKIKLV